MSHSDDQSKKHTGTKPPLLAQIVRTWMMASLLVGMLLVFSMGLVVYHQSIERQAMVNIIICKAVVLTEIESTASLITDAETGQRGFLLTGNNLYLDSY